jgi:hypothetical protein
MDDRSIGNRYSCAGIALGAVALLLTVAHFWAGPFADAAPLEQTIATRIEGFRDAGLAAIRGEERTFGKGMLPRIDPDRALRIAAAVTAALAMVLAVVGYTRGEKPRAIGGAFVLGGVALTSQYAVAVLSVLLFFAIVRWATNVTLEGCCCCD